MFLSQFCWQTFFYLASRCLYYCCDKNRFKKWFNRLPEDSCPKKWERIQEFVRTIWTTKKETILKAWEKTKLMTDFDFEQELENADVEEEFILQTKMEKLMIDFQNDD